MSTDPPSVPTRCCTPGRASHVDGATPAIPAASPAPAATGVAGREHATPGLISLDGGTFLMGGPLDEAIAGDGEGPPRRVELAPFAIAATTVTNRDFARFVRDTRHVTDAERLGSSFVFHLQVPPDRRRALRRMPGGLPWWLDVPDACWQRPEGPHSNLLERADHPVVHVSWHDAVAYCRWAGGRLPSEAQWEYAARGGLVSKRYPWGDALEPDGRPMCNIWQGTFPDAPATPWRPTTVPAGHFEPNGYGLYDTAGNVWEWCDDAFDAAYHQRDPSAGAPAASPTAPRSQRGGSFLCHVSYCNRYRVAARHSNTPHSASSNTGFRIAAVPGDRAYDFADPPTDRVAHASTYRPGR
ncbi:MAG: formylglycine-generating enzyme family protein [Lautropia sp.]